MSDRATGDRLARIAFLISAIGLTYLFGVASMKFDIFPVPQLKRAKVGFEALLQVEDLRKPDNFIESVHEAPDSLVGGLPGADRGELILVTGNFDMRPEICPDHGCLAWIMDRQGRVWHSWDVDPATLFSAADLAGHRGIADATSFFVQGVDIGADGSLLVTFQAHNLFPYQLGAALFGPDGTLIWKAVDMSHHWGKLAANGDALLPWAEIVQPPPELVPGTSVDTNCIADYGAVYDEGFRVVGRDGRQKRAVLFRELFARNDLMGLVYAVRDGCDPYHINGVEEVSAAVAARVRGAAEGDILISLRSPSALIIVDRTEDVVHLVLRGHTVAQHSPRNLPDGRIAAFDNLGNHLGTGISRILAIDPLTRSSETLYPRAGSLGRLNSDVQGVVEFDADGERALISETMTGRVLEVDLQSGQTLWEYENISDMAIFARRTGIRPETSLWRAETRGAEYLDRGWVTRTFAPPPIRDLPVIGQGSGGRGS